MTGPIDPRVNEWLRGEAPSEMDDAVVDRVLRQTRATPQRRAWFLRFEALFTRGIATAVGVAAVTIVVLLLPWVGPPDVGPDPSATPVLSAHPSASPLDASAPPSPSASSAVDPLESWTITPMPDPAPAYRGGIPEDAVAGGPGFVAVGRATPCCADATYESEPWASAIWTSVDGSDWDLVPDLASFGRSGLTAIAADGGGSMVAVGYDVLPPAANADAIGFRMRPTAWRSENGIDWIAVEAPGDQVFEVAFAANGWLIGGIDEGKPTIWHSTDLRTWTEVGLDGYGHVRQIVPGDGGLLAVGCADDELEGTCPGAAWFSNDGQSWSRSGLELTSIEAATFWGGAFVVVGSEGDSSGHTWSSPDGLRWSQGERVPGSGVSVEAMTESDGALIAGGSALGGDPSVVQPRLWMSADGVRWEQLADPQRVQGETSGIIHVVLPTATGTVALGEVFTTGAAPYAWTAPE